MAIVSVQITALSETGVILKEHMRYKKDSGIHSSFAYVMQTIERWKGDRNVAKIVEVTQYDVCSSTEIEDGMHEIELWVRYREDEIVKLEPVNSPLPEMFKMNTTATPPKIKPIDWAKPIRHNRTKDTLKVLHIRKPKGNATVILLNPRTEAVLYCSILGCDCRGDFAENQYVENIPEYEEKEVQFWANIRINDDKKYYGYLHASEEAAIKYSSWIKNSQLVAIPIKVKLKIPTKGE